MIKIYNTFSKKKEQVDLSQEIGLYVCGITPYDTTHLGHAFTFLTYDLLVHYLRFIGKKVTYVQNVTDIDDDILIRAKKVRINWIDLGRKETQKHLQNMDALSVLRPDYFPKATENISSIIRIIEVLLEKRFAYETNGSVYFEVKKDKNFGNLSGFSYSAMLHIANERGNFPLDPNKKDPLDFVLWQKSQKDEPWWNSPWGKGRPGWHIECSAMSMKYLGKTITIHGGGEDLIFPHHESEIAQSENFTNQKFVKLWMHVAMVYCDHKKMSKSLGNMIFISDLLKKYSANAIRLYLFLHHYRKSWNYDEKEMESANKISKILVENYKDTKPLEYSRLKITAPRFVRSLEDDLDSPRALEEMLKISKNSDENSKAILATAGKIFGLN